MTWDPHHLPSQAGKTFVVTGATAGLGYFIAEQLAGSGADIVIAARNQKKIDAATASLQREVPGAKVTGVLLDLGSFESVRAAAKVLAKLPRIDALIENAGHVTTSGPKRFTSDGLELTIGTNFVGHFLLTALLYPTLAKTPGSRIIGMGSEATRLAGIDIDDLQLEQGFSAWKAYGQSKHAVQVFGFELDRRLRAAGSSVISLVAHPGSSQDGNSPERPGVVEPSRGERIRAKVLFVLGGGKQRGAQAMVRAATDPDAVGGQYYGPRGGMVGAPILTKPTKRDLSPKLGRELWAKAEELSAQKFEL